LRLVASLLRAALGMTELRDHQDLYDWNAVLHSVISWPRGGCGGSWAV